jgi:hypothetical protein
MNCLHTVLLGTVVFATPIAAQEPKPDPQKAVDDFLDGRFRWTVSAPLIGPAD